MRRYETIFIIRPDLGEPQIKDIIKRFEGLASSGGGEIIETEEWGFRELAYHIKGERRGYYVRLDYASDAPYDERDRAQPEAAGYRAAVSIGAGRDG